MMMVAWSGNDRNRVGQSTCSCVDKVSDMSRNVLYFADGTWQSAASPDQSNVIKLFDALDGANTLGGNQDPEQERASSGVPGKSDHVAKYIDGVGVDGGAVAKLLGGAIGTGLIAHVLRGYTFVSRRWRAGDRIFLIGFSRGAYTARTLAGLIATMGLLDWDALGLDRNKTDDTGYCHAAAAWQAFMRKRSDPNMLGAVEQLIGGLPTAITGFGQQQKYIAGVHIDTVGVFDTVGAMGIPQIDIFNGVAIDAMKFTDLKLGPMINAGFHAVAIDEQRINFCPTLWDADTRVTQLLFPGAHADVGGGYPIANRESDLSDAARGWMADKLASRGVNLALPIVQPDFALGPQHEPWRSGPWPTAPRHFPPRTASLPAQLALSNEAMARRNQTVTVIAETKPPQPRQEQYAPASLTNAGY